MAIGMLWGTCLRVFGSRALDFYMLLFPPAVSANACSSCPIGCLSLRGSEPFNKHVGKIYKALFWGSNSAFSGRYANSSTLQGKTLTCTRRLELDMGLGPGGLSSTTGFELGGDAWQLPVHRQRLPNEQLTKTVLHAGFAEISLTKFI